MTQGVASYMYSRQAEEQIRMTTAYDPRADWRREDRISALEQSLAIPDHDCPWRGRPFGAPFCDVCDDHYESVDDDDVAELARLRALVAR